MNSWQVQAMKEAVDAQVWEEMNLDPCEKQLRDASLEMRLAVEQIDKAENYLIDAVNALDGTPMMDKVGALLETLLDLKIDIRLMAEKYAKGVRE